MTGAERVRAEHEVLGLDVSHHVLDFYAPLLPTLQITPGATFKTAGTAESCSSPG